jgi:shikimate 5-dehydrogenase
MSRRQEESPRRSKYYVEDDDDADNELKMHILTTLSGGKHMSKVLIIGAGGVGQVVTHKCAQAKDAISEITLASRTKSKCDAIAAQIASPIKTAQVDADNVPELVELIKAEKPKMVINVALPTRT